MTSLSSPQSQKTTQPSPERIIKECIHKLTQIIIRTRIPSAAASTTGRTDKWFNLLLPEVENVRQSVDQEIKQNAQGFQATFEIDIVLSAPSVSRLLLERWSVHFAPDELTSPHKPKSIDASNMYKRMIILVRSLYSYVRVLPLFQLYKSALGLVQNQQSAPFTLEYTLSSSSARDAPIFDSSPSNFCFTPIDAPKGKLHLTVFYRKEVPNDFEPRSQTIQPHIVENYIPNDKKPTATPSSRGRMHRHLSSESPPSFSEGPSTGLPSPSPHSGSSGHSTHSSHSSSSHGRSSRPITIDPHVRDTHIRRGSDGSDSPVSETHVRTRTYSMPVTETYAGGGPAAELYRRGSRHSHGRTGSTGSDDIDGSDSRDRSLPETPASTGSRPHRYRSRTLSDRMERPQIGIGMGLGAVTVAGTPPPHPSRHRDSFGVPDSVYSRSVPRTESTHGGGAQFLSTSPDRSLIYSGTSPSPSPHSHSHSSHMQSSDRQVVSVPVSDKPVILRRLSPLGGGRRSSRQLGSSSRASNRIAVYGTPPFATSAGSSGSFNNSSSSSMLMGFGQPDFSPSPPTMGFLVGNKEDGRESKPLVFRAERARAGVPQTFELRVERQPGHQTTSAVSLSTGMSAVEPDNDDFANSVASERDNEAALGNFIKRLQSAPTLHLTQELVQSESTVRKVSIDELFSRLDRVVKAYDKNTQPAPRTRSPSPSDVT